MSDDSTDYYDRIVDEASLRSYLAEELGPAEEFSVEHHQEGHSNETLFVTWGSEDLVLRRPPPGYTADSAHDVLREYRTMDALQATSVRVPPTRFACEDGDVLGSPFFVMDRVTGDVLRGREPDRFASSDGRRAIGTELVDRLAEIHEVDYTDVGLEEGEFGYPSGYTERQVRRWSDQLAWSREVTEDERFVEELDTVASWLSENVPAPDDHPNTLVHGDYKLDNLMFGPGQSPEVVAIFDWELATLGDPFTELAWMLYFWADGDDPDPAIPGLMPEFTAREGYPSRRELIERYEARTGFTFRNRTFYHVLSAFKVAALGEMFFRRYLEGNADDPLYPAMRDGVPAVARRALALIDDGPVRGSSGN